MTMSGKPKVPPPQPDYYHALKRAKARLEKHGVEFIHELSPEVGPRRIRGLRTLLGVAAFTAEANPASPIQEVEHEVNILDLLARALRDWPLPDHEQEQPRIITRKTH